MFVNRQIFREYDIRGEVAADLPTELVVELGRAFAGYCCERGGHRLVMGRDMRSTSDRLRSDLLEGLLAGGMEVTDLGVCPTPALYFGSLHLGADAGVMITGSHNPPAENGFKLLFDQRPVYGAEIRKILASVESGLPGRVGSVRGSVTEIRLLDEYQSGLRAGLKPVSKRLRVVVDCGNGTAGPVAIPLYEALGCEVVPLFAEPDGSFPNHHPDPSQSRGLPERSRSGTRLRRGQRPSGSRRRAGQDPLG